MMDEVNKQQRANAPGLIEIERSRQDGHRQRYWVRQDQLQKNGRIIGQPRAAHSQRQINTLDQQQQYKQLQAIPENQRTSQHKQTMAALESIFNQRSRRQQKWQNIFKKRLPEAVIRGTYSKLRTLLGHQPLKVEQYKQAVQNVDPNLPMVQHTEFDPHQQTYHVINHYLEHAQQDPGLAKKLHQHLPDFLDYFSKTLPTHTTSLSNLTLAQIGGTLLSSKHIRKVRQQMLEHEQKVIEGHLSKYSNLGPAGPQAFEDRFGHQFKALMHTWQQKLEDPSMTKTERAQIEDKLKTTSQYYQMLKKGAATYNVRKFDERGHLVPGEWEHAYLKNTIRPLLAKQLLEGRDSTHSLQNRGYGNSADEDVGVDSKVFLALHSASRYAHNHMQPATLVFNRDTLGQKGATISLQNASNFASSRLFVPSAAFEGIFKDVKKKDVRNGKLLLHDLNDPHTVLALALHAAANFDGLKASPNPPPITSQNRQQLEQQAGGGTYLAKYHKPNAGRTTLEEKLQGQTRSKPFMQAEGHLPSPTAIDSATHIIFPDAEAADLFKQHAPHLANRVHVGDPDRLVEEFAQQHTAPHNPITFDHNSGKLIINNPIRQQNGKLVSNLGAG